jgi:hypothetical protein
MSGVRKARIELGGGAALVIEEPVTAAEAPPPPDLSALPGAELVAHGAAQTASGPVAWSCAGAPVAIWVTGLERAVLDGASAVLRRHLGLSSVAAGEVETHAWGHARVVTAPGVQARHLLGFDGADRGVLCTLSGEAIEAHLVGTAALPRESSGSRLAAAMIAHPGEALAAVAAVVIFALAVVVARRPRPRSRLTALDERRRRS